MGLKLIIIVFLLALVAGLSQYLSRGAGRAVAQPLPPPNIIVILTDDQRFDTLCTTGGGLAYVCQLASADRPMPTVEGLIATGVTFTNAFVSNPLCCPFRGSLLSGGYYSHHTNVISNKLPNGGVTVFADTDTLATRLQASGYATALIGKYLNEYASLVDPVAGTGYVPPGWSKFVASYVRPNWRSNFSHVIGSSTPINSASGTITATTDGTYLTDYQRDQALSFIAEHCPSTCDAPLFLLFAPHAPHSPATPALRHKDLFSDFLYRDRGWAEQPDGDISDKPQYVQDMAVTWNSTADDPYHVNALRSLRAVDEAVAAILADLSAKGLLTNSIIIFASDNGYLWGEHKLARKSQVYEEAVRVPLIIQTPTAVAGTVIDKLVSADVDLPTTILDAAGINTIANDGSSLLPLIADPSYAWRSSLLLQNFSNDPDGDFLPSWAGVRTADNWKYVEYASGEKELYDLSSDPFELTSLHDHPDYVATQSALASSLASLGRGVAIKTDNLPNTNSNILPAGVKSIPYSFQFTAWGGDGTYNWSVFNDGKYCLGGLPTGLTLSSSGLVSGTPTKRKTHNFCVKASDTSISPQPGNTRPQSHIKKFKLTIN